jgi:hypothetical protein
MNKPKTLVFRNTEFGSCGRTKERRGKMNTPDVRIGQIWKENDKRFNRLVEVVGLPNDLVVEIYCKESGRKTCAKRSRFNSGRNNYSLVV